MVGDRVEALRRNLLHFYDTRRRELPWRDDPDPYRVWVSEVMLQQTRVETVVPYYHEWLRRFPDVESLAAADTEDVLSAWEGLGYYARARNLHRAARVVRERHGGRVPGDVSTLRTLPGVGEYTAGAVASIAFGEPVPAVDGNVKRVLSRIEDLPAPTASDFRTTASALVDPDRPGDLNQALMELGATVCVPRNPRCGVCPVRDRCLALARGTVGQRPRKRARGPVPEEDWRVLVATTRELRVLLARRPLDGLLGGLWEFPGDVLPRSESGSTQGSEVHPPTAGDEGLRRLAARFGIPLSGEPRELAQVSHAFTHKRVHYRVAWIQVEAATPPASATGSEVDAPAGAEEASGGVETAAPVRWVPVDRLEEVPMPVAQREIARHLREALAPGNDPVTT